ncbi:Agmatinase [Chromobacterium vaccinii]|nr:Agmatinase [Chromobacterium vaccinii]
MTWPWWTTATAGSTRTTCPTIKPSIIKHARAILASGAKMLTFGGDRYVIYPLLIADAEKYGKPLALLHFDAHCDTWPDGSPDSLNHGTMFYKAVKEGLIDPKRSVRVGSAPGTTTSWA